MAERWCSKKEARISVWLVSCRRVLREEVVEKEGRIAACEPAAEKRARACDRGNGGAISKASACERR